MIVTFAGNVKRELSEVKESLEQTVISGVNSETEYNRLVGQIKGLNRALATIDETLQKYDSDESSY